MSQQDQQDSSEPFFWTRDIELCEATIYGEAQMVRSRVHVAEEEYTGRYAGNETLHGSHGSGIRDYVLIHPYILIPDIQVTVALSPAAQPDEPASELVESAWTGMKEERIGDGQAWFYRRDQTLELWDCLPFEQYRAETLLTDGTLTELWHGFETYLMSNFPEAQRIVAPSWEPSYDSGVWQAFLQVIGYRKLNQKAYVKDVPQ